MNLDRRYFLSAAGIGAFGITIPGVFSPMEPAAPNAVPAQPSVPAAVKAAEQPPLLQKALAALDTHGARIGRREKIGLVDFSRHSSERRLQVVDVGSGKVDAEYLVAHGRGSDPGHTGFVEKFSNRMGSNATSRGSYLVANTYYGKYGRSRRVLGLDPDNDLALERAIVIHGAPYVDPGLVDAQGRIGRSLGCFSVADGKISEVLDRLGEGCLLYADIA